METKNKILWYTEPSRDDGAWDGEVGPMVSGGYPSAEIYKFRRSEPGAGRSLNSRRPVCAILDPDFDPDGGQDSGNMALLCYAPEMYETLVALRSEIIRAEVIASDTIGRMNHVLDNIMKAADDFEKIANTEEE